MFNTHIIELLRKGGVSALFASLLVFTLYTSNEREQRLSAQIERQQIFMVSQTSKLEEISRTLERIERRYASDAPRVRGK
ncbi:MAG: hypothetical protein L0Y55_04110 [Anaerolineales bacterium]|nr:hypothetical protein [Anaerolineales bacterium]